MTPDFVRGFMWGVSGTLTMLGVLGLRTWPVPAQDLEAAVKCRCGHGRWAHFLPGECYGIAPGPHGGRGCPCRKFRKAGAERRRKGARA